MRPAIAERQDKGLTQLEVSVVIACLAMLALLILPALFRVKQLARRIRCTNNLNQVGLSFLIYKSDHGGKFPMQISTSEKGSREFVAGGNAFRHLLALSNELSSPVILVCPADRRKAVTNFAALGREHLSYFVGLDASTNYSGMFLAGDRNITNDTPLNDQILLLTTNQTVGWSGEIHRYSGNVAFADGSVQQVSSTSLQKALRNSGVATNRLAIP